jgi:hypothetical protein
MLFAAPLAGLLEFEPDGAGDLFGVDVLAVLDGGKLSQLIASRRR